MNKHNCYCSLIVSLKAKIKLDKMKLRFKAEIDYYSRFATYYIELRSTRAH